MYPGFARVADDEGFKEASALFRSIAVAEERHRDRYLALLKKVEGDAVFSSGQSERWICRKCGYVHEAGGAPNVCPVCSHPQAYFELEATNY
jgi:rubrerythrin